MDILGVEIAEQPAASRSSTIQYFSLIMIVLTFIVGSFARQKLEHSSALQTLHSGQNRRRVIEEPRLSSELVYSDLVKDGQVNQETAGALAELLKNHDLRMEIELSVSAGGQAAARSSSVLLRYLLEQGVPPEAVEVYAVSGRPGAYESAGARVRFCADGLEAAP
jgi:hypothetical protein